MDRQTERAVAEDGCRGAWTLQYFYKTKHERIRV